MKGNLSFTIAEGKPLANLPNDGQAVQLRNTNGTLATYNGIITLSWTENGVGIHITGKLHNQSDRSHRQLTLVKTHKSSMYCISRV